MGKLLFWLVVIFAALLVVRLIAYKTQAAKRPVSPPPAKPRFGTPSSNEAMVRCAHCGIHLPRSEAYMQQGQTWCCAEHAKLGARQ